MWELLAGLAQEDTFLLCTIIKMSCVSGGILAAALSPAWRAAGDTPRAALVPHSVSEEQMRVPTCKFTMRYQESVKKLLQLLVCVEQECFKSGITGCSDS